jgi:putative hemolysin
MVPPMTGDLVAPLGMAMLIAASGLVSGSETAVFSLRPPEIERLVQSGTRLGHLLGRLLGEVSSTLLAILLFNNVVNIAYFAIAGWWGAQHTGLHQLGIYLGSLVVLITFGEILPKVLASTNPTWFASLLAPLLYLLVLVTTPVCRVIEWLLPGVSDNNPGLAMETISNDELKHVVQESHKEGVVSELAHDRLLEIIDLSKTPAYEVMTHRVDCPTVHEHDDMEVARNALVGNKLPLVLVVDPQEECIGVLTAQDVLRGGRIAKRMRKPLFLPDGALLPTVITVFQNTGATFAVVVDEYGGTAGLLTLAHVGQALLGAGRSEDLPEVAEPVQLDTATWRISGQMPLDAWEELIDEQDLSGCTTIGGFITRSIGSVPEHGDRLLYRNLQFEVAEVAGHRIASLVVKQLPAEEARRLSREHRR